jgi:hypothetical protein
MNKLKIFRIENTGGPVVYRWDDERGFCRVDSTITINWPRLGTVLIVQPMTALIGHLSDHKYKTLLVGLGGVGAVYGLYKQKKLILLFLGKIKSLEQAIIDGNIRFVSLEELYDEVIAMAQNAIKQLHLVEKLNYLDSVEILNLKQELGNTTKSLLESSKLAYFQQEALKICEKGSSNLPNSKALEYLHKIADSEAQKNVRISKMMAKLLRKQALIR